MRSWFIHALNQLDRRTEEVRVAVVQTREAIVRADRAGWWRSDLETRHEVEEEGMTKGLQQVAGRLMEISGLVDQMTKLTEREQRGEDVGAELEALVKELEALRL